VGTTGAVTVLFPNKYDTSNFVKAGRIYSIPSAEAEFKIEVEGPAGKELVKAIATTKTIDITGIDLSLMEAIFKSIPMGTQFAGKLDQILASSLSPNSKDAALPTNAWATDSIAFKVE
jgi:hypothetical protein